MSNTESIVKQIKQFFEEETIKRQDPTKAFSNDVVSLAYQKLSDQITDAVQIEEDPTMICELLKQYLEVTKLIDEQGLNRQQFLLKLFEQLNKYEQSKYY